MPARRWTDASKLSFPLQLVITIVAAAIGSVLAVKSAQGNIEKAQNSLDKAQIELAATLKTMSAQMSADKQVADANAKVTELTNAQMKAAIENLTRELRMTQVTVQQLQEKVLVGRR